MSDGRFELSQPASFDDIVEDARRRLDAARFDLAAAAGLVAVGFTVGFAGTVWLA